MSFDLLFTILSDRILSYRLQDSTLERQNESELNQLHGKIKSLRHVSQLDGSICIILESRLNWSEPSSSFQVTIDILSDSQRQNEQVSADRVWWGDGKADSFLLVYTARPNRKPRAMP